jgi:hypothetical protein
MRYRAAKKVSKHNIAKPGKPGKVPPMAGKVGNISFGISQSIRKVQK